MLAALRDRGATVFPGDPEQAAQARHRADGIPVSAELASELNGLAERLGVLPLAAPRG
jgi:LDH2 family malate/lactate/ureidoglycolate dehydrogenase